MTATGLTRSAIASAPTRPALLRMCLEAGDHYPTGLDTLELQQHFRWNTPVEIVTRMIPPIIERGDNPYDLDYPHSGFPDITTPRPGHRLTREFLVDIARDYLTADPPYANTLARRYNVTPRTVVSWVREGSAAGHPGEQHQRTQKPQPESLSQTSAPASAASSACAFLGRGMRRTSVMALRATAFTSIVQSARSTRSPAASGIRASTTSTRPAIVV